MTPACKRGGFLYLTEGFSAGLQKSRDLTENQPKSAKSFRRFTKKGDFDGIAAAGLLSYIFEITSTAPETIRIRLTIFKKTA